MAFSYGFFNAKNLDRTYTAENFCDYLGSIICNGIQDNYGGCFNPTASKLKLAIASGKAWIDGHYFISDTAYTFDLSRYVDESLPRYVSIGICCNTGENFRSIEFELSVGTPATNPTIPKFTNTDTKTYLTLFAVKIEAGAIDLKVTDYRNNYTYCGYVRCILGKCKVTDMLSQLDEILEQMKEYNTTITQLTNKVAELTVKVDEMTGDVIAIGKCGEDINYVWFSDGRVILKGTGAMYDYGNFESDNKSPFYDSENVKSVVFSEGITSVGEFAFVFCNNLKSATLPSTLTTIKRNGFMPHIDQYLYHHELYGLATLKIPNKVTELARFAFSGTQLQSVTIPSSVVTVGDQVFAECQKLITVRYGGKGISDRMFVRCVKLANFTITKTCNAADICCYGQVGNPISSKIVCCTAQDLGFGGIANITSEYIYTHVDVRTGLRWLGDETVSNNSVTSDFYQYFAPSKDAKNGIDLSEHNGSVDWNKIKADFVIIRAGFGCDISQKDDRFEENYAGAKAHNIPVGAYWYSYAMDENEARLEADVFLATIKGKQFEYPVFYDVEESKQFELGKEKLSAIIRAFLERVETAGYFVGLYGSASSLVTHTGNDIKEKYTIWLAHWCDSTNYSGAYGIWQHSCKGKVDGIIGDVDLDKCYVDYPERIKAKGLNGYGDAPTSAPVPNDSVSVEVTVDGKKYSGKLNKT